jgi:hypothetical protein
MSRRAQPPGGRFGECTLTFDARGLPLYWRRHSTARLGPLNPFIKV